MKERQKREDVEKHGMKFKIPNIVSVCVCLVTRRLLVMGHSEWGSFRGKLRVGIVLRDPTKRAKGMEMGFRWTRASKSTPTGRRLPPRSLESKACNLLMSCPRRYEREPTDAKQNCARVHCISVNHDAKMFMYFLKIRIMVCGMCRTIRALLPRALKDSGDVTCIMALKSSIDSSPQLHGSWNMAKVMPLNGHFLEASPRGILKRKKKKKTAERQLFSAIKGECRKSKIEREAVSNDGESIRLKNWIFLFILWCHFVP